MFGRHFGVRARDTVKDGGASMSVKVMSLVWQHSVHKGGDLLLLLAIADNASDDGVAWPSIAMLAHKTRLGERAVQYNLQALTESGELTVIPGGGRGHPNQYVIHVKGEKIAPNRAGQTVQPTAPLNGEQTPQRIAPNPQGKGAKTSKERVQKPAAHIQGVKPSIEPSVKSGDAAPSKPLPEHGPAQQIVAEYCRVAGIDRPASYRKSVGQAEQIAKAGVVAKDIPALYAFVAEWANGADLGTMLAQIDKWRSSLHRTKNGASPPIDWNDPEQFEAYRAQRERENLARLV